MDHLVDTLAGGDRASGTLVATIAATVVTAGFTALGHLHAQLVAAVFPAVELLDDGFTELGAIEVHKPEAAASTGFTVHHGLESHPGTHGGEEAFQLLLVKGLGQVADVETDAHRDSGRKEKRERLCCGALETRISCMPAES